MNGTRCDRWDYWLAGDRYSFWATHTAPLRIAKVWTAVPSYHLWHIDFENYTSWAAAGGVPVVPYFRVPAGVDCVPQARPLPAGPGCLGHSLYGRRRC